MPEAGARAAFLRRRPVEEVEPEGEGGATGQPLP